MSDHVEESPVCILCHREQQTYDACKACRQRLARWLSELLDLYWDAHACLQPGRGGHGSVGSERTLGVNLAALDWISGADILGVLHSWEKVVREERSLTPPALVPPAKPDAGQTRLDAEVRAAVDFHLTHLEWTCDQPWADDFHLEVKALRNKGLRAARVYVQQVRRIPCPADTAEGLPCGASLALPEDLLSVVPCRRCGSEWSAIRLVAVAMSAPGREVWLDAEAIASWLGLTAGHVRRLARDNAVPRRGALYEAHALLAAREARESA